MIRYSILFSFILVLTSFGHIDIQISNLMIDKG